MDYIDDKLKISACVLLIFIMTVGWGLGAQAAGDPAVLFQNANKYYVEFVRDAAKKKVRDNWLKVINEYLAIAEKYPDSDLAPEACARGAKVYEHFSRYSGKTVDLGSASRIYQDLAGRYPRSSIADDALYQAGQLEDRMGNRGMAESLFRRVLDEYAQGDMADKAGARLKAMASETKPAEKASVEKAVEKIARKSAADRAVQKARADKGVRKAPGETAEGEEATEKGAQKDPVERITLPVDVDRSPSKATAEKPAKKIAADKTAKTARTDKGSQKAPAETTGGVDVADRGVRKASSDKAAERPSDQPRGSEPDAVKAGELSRVRKISHSTGEGDSRVIVELDNASATYKSYVIPEDKALNKPARLVVDLKGTRIPRSVPAREEVDEGMITCIRTSGHPGDAVRIVLDLKENPSYQISRTEDPYGIVIDVAGANAAPRQASVKRDARNGAAPPYQSPPVKKVPKGTPAQVRKDLPSIASQLCLKVSRIVIDPGHGGRDPGAISPTGVKEKDLTLEIAKLLAKRLKADGFEVSLTRTRDEFVALEERTTFANRKRADLFVSLHINSHQNVSVSGIETYFLNLTTDSSAIEVAARENTYSDRSMRDLQLILNDLMLNSKINESAKFATAVHTSVVSSAQNTGYEGKNLGVRQAPFYVLLGAQMPSILIELGFLTNTTDIAALKKRAYQETLVDGVAKGINSYIMNTTYAYGWRNK
jgi:N-acetylmuramoyl-L-alanine amidase